MLVFDEGKTGVPGEKPLMTVENLQTQSTYDTVCGNRTRTTLVEGKCSHHLANAATTPSAYQYYYYFFLFIFFLPLVTSVL